MASYWQIQNKISNFNNLSKTEQTELIDYATSDTMKNTYYWSNYIGKLSKYINKDKFMEIFKVFLPGATNYQLKYYDNHTNDLISKAYIYEPQETLKLIKASPHKTILKHLLVLDNITEKEEELGLRALSTSKYVFDAIYKNKYKPSLKALENLPPVMRLNVLEALANRNHISYNIFENFTDPEEFKRLLFGSVLRHRERASELWDKFQELSQLGTEGNVTVKCNCDNCGTYEISLKSNMARTKSGLLKTHLFRYGFTENRCSLCGGWSHKITGYKIGE